MPMSCRGRRRRLRPSCSRRRCARRPLRAAHLTDNRLEALGAVALDAMVVRRRTALRTPPFIGHLHRQRLLVAHRVAFSEGRQSTAFTPDVVHIA